MLRNSDSGFKCEQMTWNIRNSVRYISLKVTFSITVYTMLRWYRNFLFWVSVVKWTKSYCRQAKRVVGVDVSMRFWRMLRLTGASISAAPQSSQPASAANTGVSATQPAGSLPPPSTGASSHAATTLVSPMIGSTTNMATPSSGIGQQLNLNLIETLPLSHATTTNIIRHSDII